MRLYLHVGYPKTGSSAIQKFLYLNRGKLLESNILYPETGVDKLAHNQLPWVVKDDSRVDDNISYAHHQIPWVFTHDPRAGENISEADIIEGIKREIRQNANVDTVLISSEGFIFSMSPELVQSIFSELFDEIIIIAYLRSPLKWMRSDYNQGVKGWRQLSCSFDEHINSVLLIEDCPMNYYHKLSEWAAVFRWENISIRTYDVEKSKLVESIIRVIGLDDIAGFKKLHSNDSNPGLSTGQLELLRVVNSLDLTPEDRMWLIQQLQFNTDDAVDHTGKNKNSDLYCDLSNHRLDQINLDNKGLLNHFEGGLFSDDFFSIGEPDNNEVILDQVNINNIYNIVQPLISNLVELKNKI